VFSQSEIVGHRRCERSEAMTHVINRLLRRTSSQ